MADRANLPAPAIRRQPPQLLDQWGNPVVREALLVEQAAPSIGSVRNVFSGHPADGLTPQKLAVILREAEATDARAYLELAEQMEERDLHYLGVLGKRKRSVSQLAMTVEAASQSADDKAAAELVRSALVDRLELQGELFDILDAIGKGYSVVEICWDTSMSQWMPRSLKYRHPKWFRFSLNDGETLELWDNAGYLPLVPYHFVIHKVRAKSGLAIRGGLARAAAWCYLFKNFDLKSWVSFADVYGQPIRIGKYGPGASTEDKAALLRAVTNIAQDCGAIIPVNMALELVEAKMTGNTQLFSELAAYLDQQMSKAVLGNTGTTDAIAGGHAVGKTHRQVEQDIEQSDARELETTLNRDIVRPIVDLNMGPRLKYPILRIVLPDERDVQQLSQAVGVLVDRGLQVGQAEIRRLMGINEPQPGEPVLQPATTPAQTGTPPTGPAPPSPPVLATQSQLPAPKPATPGNSIDALVAEQLADWRPVMMPLMQPVLELAARCQSYEQFLAALPSVVPQQNAMALTEALAKCLFAARLAGETRADVGPT